MRKRALLVLPASFALAIGVAAPPASAEVPPDYNTRVEAQLRPGQDTIASWGWYLDATVDVFVNGGLVAGNQAGGDFSIPADLAPGDVVTVTGDVTGLTKTLTVADHRLTTADVVADTATGTATPAPEGTFRVWAGSSPQVTPTYEAGTHQWFADFGATFDLRPGMGLQVRQDDADGDATLTDFRIPDPLVEIWDTHGVGASGWVPGSELTLTVDDPTDGQPPLVEQVTADAQGSFWDVTPPDWQPLEPGWIASVTGPVPQRETPTITKTLVLPDPIPMIDVDGTVVSDTVTGTLTDQDVGRGSRVGVIGYCEGGTDQGTTRGTSSDPATGFFSLDLSLPPNPPAVDGFGDPCTGPVLNTLYRLYDADGDMFQEWWLPEMSPGLSIQPDVVMPGDPAYVSGDGWDLGTVSLVQCRMAGGTPDFPDGCDWSTRVDTLTSPGEGWPFASSVFDQEVVPLTELATANGTFDVSGAGASAVVAFEPWRDGPHAWAEVTFAASIDVEGNARGTVSTVTGSATVGGTVTASAPVWVHLSGELRQRFSRTRVVVGGFDTWVFVDQAGAMIGWTAVVRPTTGQAFGSGKAELTVWADQGDQGGSGDMDVVTVSLTAKKR